MKHRSLCLLAGLVVGAAASWCWGEGRSQKGQPGRFTVYRKWPFDAAEAKRRQAETAKALGVKIEQDFKLAPGVKITMVLIPAGEFLMGSSQSPQEVARLAGVDPGKYAKFLKHEHPQHRVTIREPFWMGKHEVTQAQWQALTGSNPSRSKGAKNPVDSVSWYNVQEFLKKANARQRTARFALPTEAQWEYACRVGTQTPFHFGETISTEQANYDGNYTYGAGRQGVKREKTMPVGSFPANAWGLHDMHGNVYEWCSSPYSEKYDGSEQKRAEGGGCLRVVRGGSWRFSPLNCRSAARVRSPSGSVSRSYYGFRVVRSARALP